MSKVRGVVFDADGTIFDTASLIYDAYHHLAQAHGYDKPSREQVAREMGRPIPEIIAALFPGADATAMLQTNTAFVMERATSVVAFDGLEHLLKELSARGIKLGILTSGGEKIYGILKHHQLENYFQSVVHADRVQRHKPDPEGAILAASEMGVGVNELVIVGDMSQDIDVARAAGVIASVGVTHGFSTREALLGYGADYVIDSLPELLEVIEKMERTHDA